MDWIEIAVSTTSEGVDIVSQILYEVGVPGVVIQDPNDIQTLKSQDGDWDYIDESLLTIIDETVQVRGYLREDDTFHDKLQYIRDRIQGLCVGDIGLDVGSCEITLTNVKDEDWTNSWKKYFKPKKIGNRIVVKPTWEEYLPSYDEVVVDIDPGMAFGTGTHETTILCIRMLEKYIAHSHEVLDIGCGTGILAISSVLLGAKRAVAVDIDERATHIAKVNSERNNTDDRVDIIHGNLLDNIEGQFDIVVANIVSDVIIELSRDIGSFLNENGLFIVSGIILERLDEVKTALKDNGFYEVESITLGEWAVVVSRCA